MEWQFKFLRYSALVFLITGLWLSSGTLSPHVLGFENSVLERECGYVLSVDQPAHYNTFLLLDEWDPGRNGVSVIVRRILYPLIAYVPMKFLGFVEGGFLVNLFLHVLAFFAFTAHMTNRHGRVAAATTAWMLAAYPGIYYWGGLPYSYAFIVPGTIFCFLLLHRLNECRTRLAAGLTGLALGTLFLGYDFLPVFGPAAVFVLAAGRQSKLNCAAALGGLIYPSVLLALIFRAAGIPIATDNSSVYTVILASYLPPYDLQGWGHLLGKLPLILADNFLSCGFIALPLLFLIVILSDIRVAANRFDNAEKGIWTGIALLFLFTNLAPPYEGWQVRGVEWARIYQPSFVLLISYLAKYFQATADTRDIRPLSGRASVRIFLPALIIFNTTVIYGIQLGLPYSRLIFWKFYHQSIPETAAIQAERVGFRPLGFCEPQAFAEPWKRINIISR